MKKSVIQDHILAVFVRACVFFVCDMAYIRQKYKKKFHSVCIMNIKAETEAAVSVCAYSNYRFRSRNVVGILAIILC